MNIASKYKENRYAKEKKLFRGYAKLQCPNRRDEPALKGPNGESPSGFKSFKKQEDKDESFDTVNKKRMGKDTDFTSEDYVDDFYDRVSDLQKEINTSGIDDDEYDAEINKLKEELETKKDSMSEDDYNKAKEMLDRFSRPTDDDLDANDEVTDDEISEHLADYQWQVTPKTTAGQYAQECADRLGISKERVFNIIKQQAPDQIKESSNMSKIIDALEEDYEYIDDDNSSFDRFNAKRMGKEDKRHKSTERKDKYGNPLVSDDAFKVGQKVAKEYLDQLNKGEGFETAKKSFVTLDGFRDAISDALEQEGLNPDYDLTYQDLNEIIGSVTGEEVDFEDYEGGGKGWTGKKYNGYIPQENKKPKLPF